MLKSHLPKILLFSVAFAAAALGACLLVPAKYEGFVQILIDQKALVQTQAVSPIDQSVSDLIDFTRSRSITTQVQQLTSFQVLSDAGDAAARELNVPADRLDEFQAVNMRDNISVDAEIGSDIMTLRVHMTDPRYAQAFAGQAYQAFQKQNDRNTRELAGRAITFLEAQMEKANKTLHGFDVRTRQIREKFNAPDMGQQIGAEINLLAKLRDTRDQARIELNAAGGRVQRLRAELAGMPREIEASRTDAFNINQQQLEQQVSIAKAELAKLEARYHPEHPSVREAKELVNKLEAEVENHKKRLDASRTMAPNPNRQALAGQLAEARGLHSAGQQRVAQAEREYERANAGLKVFPAAQMEIEDLSRQKLSMEKLVMTYNERLETLRLAQQGRIAPTRLVTPATVLPNPVSPKTGINTLIGAIAGLIVGFVVALRSESRNLPIRSLGQLNAISFEPVYRVIPELKSPFRGLAKTPPEAYETLLVNCLRSDKRPYRVAIVGVARESGASTTALNYAIGAQRRGLRSVLVTTDPRTSIRKALGSSFPEAGGKSRVEGAFDVLNYAGKMLVSGDHGRTALDAGVVSAEADLTVFDLEPTLESADYAILSQLVDEVILLVRSDRVKTVDFLTAQQALRDAGCPHVVVVFSRTSLAVVETDRLTFHEEIRALPT